MKKHEAKKLPHTVYRQTPHRIPVASNYRGIVKRLSTTSISSLPSANTGLANAKDENSFIKTVQEELLDTLPTADAIERDAKGRRVLVYQGQRYTLINRISRSEAESITQQTGIPVVEVHSQEEYVQRQGHGEIVFLRGEDQTEPLLGAGSFGKFKLAQLADGTYVGVKKIKDHDAIVESCYEGLMQQKLKGKPYIMPLYEFVQAPTAKTHQTALYQFMPLAGLGNVAHLREHLASIQDAELKTLVITQIAKGMLLGLWHMHQAQVYHLDIKPSNVVVTKDGEVKLIDFGCAVEIPDQPPLLTCHTDSLGQNIGKGDYGYFSEEREQAHLANQPFDCAKADIYATGLSLAELLTGQACEDFIHDLESVKRWLGYCDKLGELALALLKPEAERPTVEDALNSPLFQSPKIHDSAYMETAISYLKAFVNQQRFTTKALPESREKHKDNEAKDKYTGVKLSGSDIRKVNSTHLIQSTHWQASHLVASQSKPIAAEDIQLSIEKCLQQLKVHTEAVSDSLALYVPLQGSYTRESTNVFELEDKVNEWLASDKLCLLLLADGGSGKSTFCRQWAQKLPALSQLRSNPDNNNNNNNNLNRSNANWLPIYIPLATIQNPRRLIIEVLQQQYGLTVSQIDTLKANQHILFILDGYDELRESINLYVENQLQDWQAKVLITCRPSSLKPGYHIHFTPYQTQQKEQRQASLLQEYYVASFSPEKVEQYLESYLQIEQAPLQQAVQTQQLEPKWLEKKTYQDALRTMSGLQALTQTPFLLRLTMAVLPRLSQQYQHQSIVIKSVNVYEAFLAQWQERQLAKTNFLTDNNNHGALMVVPTLEEITTFAYRLAETMYEQQVMQVQYQPQYYFNRQTEQYELKANPWQTFLNDQDSQLKFLRGCLPLREYGEQTVGFVHLSVLEYLLAYKWYQELKQLGLPNDPQQKATWPEQASQLPLNRYALTQNKKDMAKLRFLSEWVWQDRDYKQILLEVVYASKNRSHLSIFAANAITIANYARVSFTGLDFSSVLIPQADLSFSICDHTNFSQANLTQVNLMQAWLQGANFSQCQMSGVIFGQRPYLPHDNVVETIAYSPDGRYLASGLSKAILLWETATGKKMRIFLGHSNNVNSVAFSFDGLFLVSGSQDNTLKLWDRQTGKCLQTFLGHSNGIKGVAFSPDGQNLVSVSYDKTLKLWDCQTGECLQTFLGHSESINSVAFSPDGQNLVTGSDDRVLKLWGRQTGQCLHTFLGHSNGITSVAFSPDGQNLVSGSSDNTVKLWDRQTGKCLRTFLGHNNGITSVVFSPDGQNLASGSGDRTLKLWDRQTGECLRTFLGHSDVVISVAFSPDGKSLASGSWDKTLKLWDRQTSEPQQNSLGHSFNVTSIALSPDGKNLVSGSKDKTLKLWDCQTGECLQTFSGHSDWVNSVAISPDGQYLASGSRDNTLKLWDRQTGECLQTFSGHSFNVTSVTFSPDGKNLASGSHDNTLKLWNRQTGECLQTFSGHSNGVMTVAFSSDGKNLVSGSWDNTLKLWDRQSHGCLRTFLGHSDWVACIAFSPDGKNLVSGSWDNTLKLWDRQTSECLQTFSGHSDSINSVAFSPDGQLLASGSQDKTLKLWDTKTHQSVASLTGYLGGITSVVWLSTTILVTGSEGHDVKVWYNQEGTWQLAWSSHTYFNAMNCQIHQAQGLTDEQQRLLEQLGAVGKPLAADNNNVPMNEQSITSPFKKPKPLKSITNLLKKGKGLFKQPKEKSQQPPAKEKTTQPSTTNTKHNMP